MGNLLCQKKSERNEHDTAPTGRNADARIGRPPGCRERWCEGTENPPPADAGRVQISSFSTHAPCNPSRAIRTTQAGLMQVGVDVGRWREVAKAMRLRSTPSGSRFRARGVAWRHRHGKTSRARDRERDPTDSVGRSRPGDAVSGLPRARQSREVGSSTPTRMVT